MSTRWLSVAVLLFSSACGADGPPLPVVPPEGLEPAVAARLAAAYATAEDDASAEHLLDYGRVLFGHRHHAAAFDVLRRAAALGGPVAFESTYLAALAASESDLAEAERLMTRALRMEPRFVAGHVKHGMFREELDRLADAEFSYTAALRIERSSHALLGLGRVALARGEPDRAIGLLEGARVLDPRHHEVDVALAQAYTAKGWTDDARAARDRATGHAEITAIPDPVLNRALDQNVSYHGLVDRAQHRYISGDVRGALALVDLAVLVDAAHARAHLVSCQILRDMGDHEGAIIACNRVLAVTPKHAEALARRGTAHAELEQIEAAEASLREAVAIGGELPLPRRELARFLLTQENAAEARTLLETLLRDHPDDLLARLLMASVHAKAGEWDAAHAQAEYVVRRRPTDVIARRLMAEAARER